MFHYINGARILILYIISLGCEIHRYGKPQQVHVINYLTYQIFSLEMQIHPTLSFTDENNPCEPNINLESIHKRYAKRSRCMSINLYNISYVPLYKWGQFHYEVCDPFVVHCSTNHNINMGKVSLFIMFSRILVFSYNIFGCCVYALHQVFAHANILSTSIFLIIIKY